MAETTQDWSVDTVVAWLNDMNFSSRVTDCCRRHAINGQVLLMLSEQDIKDIIGTSCIGDTKRLYHAVRQLRSSVRSADDIDLLAFHSTSSDMSPANMERSRVHKTGRAYHRLDSDDTHLRISSHLAPEYTKLVLSYTYMFTVFLLSSMVMVVVHDRVPDMKKYPPLPDIVLDNVPYIPWAFEMCELTGLILMIIWTTTMIFHKHRFIILRRMFSLTGTVFLLRCITMLITSLSVPGTHLQCAPKSFDNIWSKLQRAVIIWQGMGMSLQGVRTCGDYMFSGHTVMVTMLNFFITEYTPRSMHLLHTATWVMNIFAVFFILAAHEHYSIDVFIAFYITSRLFLYYHSLANNRVLRQGDNKRTRVWFPMFSYFEAQIDGIVPNEYELPWEVVASKFFSKTQKQH